MDVNRSAGYVFDVRQDLEHHSTLRQKVEHFRMGLPHLTRIGNACGTFRFAGKLSKWPRLAHVSGVERNSRVSTGINGFDSLAIDSSCSVSCVSCQSSPVSYRLLSATRKISAKILGRTYLTKLLQARGLYFQKKVRVIICLVLGYHDENSHN